MTDSARIFKHPGMCQIEGVSLQKGMNFLPLKDHSVLLMSRRKNAPYRDHVEADGTLIYEGHDMSRSSENLEPKAVDQPQYLPSGKLTENGKFLSAVNRHKIGGGTRAVRVYEKLREGIWADNGIFELIDAWSEHDGRRQVFKFKLVLSENGEAASQRGFAESGPRSRTIPSAIKQEVWVRDGGKCRTCQASDELHFDHILPYSKGGSSVLAENVQLLCARHNLEKRDRIE
ncbi:MAG TPA: HNH endonuclease [Rhizomicrobium sp.]|jgi:hypothetical protein|nr:HNH endonuclease [Rhizomicrobium sp.]